MTRNLTPITTIHACIGTRRSVLLSLLTFVAAALCLVFPARAQLREPEVLVLYDSRISDSVLVAEHYAGSAKVLGGLGGIAGAHPRVLVLNLFTLAAVGASGQAGFAAPVTDIDYSTFKSRLRDPLRAYLTANSLTYRVRSIVLTKGLPHRIQDQTTPTIGDNPGGVGAAVCGGNLTYSSVDIELALLWQNLDTGEAGGKGDSKRDGWIDNPYYGDFLPHAAWPRSYLTTQTKSYSVPQFNIGCGTTFNADLGVWWFITSPPDPTNSSSLTAGDLYLVCRLDGNAVTDVYGIIDRAQNIVANTSTAAFILDADSNGYDGGTYGNTQAVLTGDGRFKASNVLYNTTDGVTGFDVGPRIVFSGNPVVISSPILLIASYGANHSGVGSPMNTTYANSFNYAPGAVFNTLESYNGRGYGGLVGGLPQQQSADALAAGCTFALCNVYEPFELTVADNTYMAQNFFLGNLSFAEAAYTSLPELSWAQMVVGDPLARIRRDTEDVNADGQLTIDDLYAWKATPRDLNRDGTADDTDYQLLESAVRGPELINMKGDQR